MLVDSSDRIHGKLGFLLESEAELPVQVGLVGVELSAVAIPASFLYDASQL
ncbi:hypothetical protein A2U01_0091173, partial [Trifolium medium]|nr:hypothetical protein [Trifolium medium]